MIRGLDKLFAENVYFGDRGKNILASPFSHSSKFPAGFSHCQTQHEAIEEYSNNQISENTEQGTERYRVDQEGQKENIP